MVCGYLPFEDANTGELYKKILACDYKAPKFISAGAKDLIACLLNTDPNKRYGIEEIRNHAWYRQNKEELCPGILVGYNSIPVDSYILSMLEKFDLKLDYVRQCIEANKHNSKTTGYYLLLKKHLMSGGSTVEESENTKKKSKKKRSFSINLPDQTHPPLFRLTQENLYRPPVAKTSNFHQRGNSTQIGRHSRSSSVRQESPKTRITNSVSPQRAKKKINNRDSVTTASSGNKMTITEVKLKRNK